MGFDFRTGAPMAVRWCVPAAALRRLALHVKLQFGHIAQCVRHGHAGIMDSATRAHRGVVGRHRTRAIERRRRIERQSILRRLRIVNVMRDD